MNLIFFVCKNQYIIVDFSEFLKGMNQVIYVEKYKILDTHFSFVFLFLWHVATICCH